MAETPLMPITNLWSNGWQADELRADGWTLHIVAQGLCDYTWDLRRGDLTIKCKHSETSRQKSLRAAYNYVCDKKLWRPKDG